MLVEKSAQGNIQNHHDGKSQGEGQRSNIGVGAFGHLRDQFLHHHIQHGTGGKTEQVRQGRDQNGGAQNGDQGSRGFYDAGEDTVPQARLRETPSARRGREMMAPSGKF